MTNQNKCVIIYTVPKGTEKIFKGSDNTMKEKIMNALKDIDTTYEINDSQAVIYWNGFQFNRNTLEFLLKKANISYTVKGRTVEDDYVLTWYDCSGYKIIFVY